MVKRVQVRQNTTQRATVQEVELGDVRVRLRAQWNASSDRWYVSLYTLADALILGSVPCVPGVDLLRPYKHLAIPQGQLFCSARDREPPSFSTMDTTARVLYR